MTRSYHRLFYHLVWSTKNREPFIQPEVEKRLYPFLRKKTVELNGVFLEMNGIEDHLHLLVQLPPTQNLARFMKDLKGSSSHYLTNTSGLGVDFKWQVGYGVFTVSEDVIPRIRQYIRNQKEHHREGSTLGEWERDNEIAKVIHTADQINSAG
ncbi:MAG: IS200/IS605 family transposase [Deltaproteobacteria bacterium]|nr:IS200/IS605 family transposase [Deltaproteobacteria bacterium]